ncbi:MAG: hypothetical protein K1X29_08520 [Bdellovibrionales bacterium]|nr:hypothetical protein [Bdellovibrionales bacterium]
MTVLKGLAWICICFKNSFGRLDAEYLEKMEDVPDVYAHPYDAKKSSGL